MVKNQDMGVWVVMPAHNEQKYIGKVLNDTKKYVKNIVVVDDGSSDDTCAIAKRYTPYVISHKVNLGKGAALKTGCEYILWKISNSERLKKRNFIIFMDSDGQHKPKDIPRLLEKMKNKDIVFASRNIDENMPLVMRFGNYVINTVSKILFKIDINDSQSGFRAFDALLYEKIKWKSSDYSVESEIIANAGKHKLKYSEIFIDTIYNDKYKGTTVWDGVRIVYTMFILKMTR
jgi:glycosyltransferase involved in cell wall biosynthesis